MRLIIFFILMAASTATAATEHDRDKVTTYSTILGRAVACGGDIKQPMKKVGAWMDRTFTKKERASQMLIFTTAIQYSAEQQNKGQSPDTCFSALRAFSKTNWP